MRDKQIIKISVYGIVVNLFLVVIKAIVGFVSNSIAITLDAVNNLSDTFSSTITIIGTKLSGKKPDKEHPFGHGRIEYLSAIAIALIILVAGVIALKESIVKIIKPEMASYSRISLIVIALAVFVKFFFGRYVRSKGKALNSGNLIASGTDAISDAFLSLSTLIGALINVIWGLNIEGFLGLLISVFIIKAALEILRNTINDVIGTRAEKQSIKKLKKIIGSYDGVLGVYDVILHSYGPNKTIGSAHIQVNDCTTAKEIHILTRKIQEELFNKMGIIITLGIYASNDSGIYGEIKKELAKIIKEYSNIIQLHGFYVDEKEKNISFDLIFNFNETNPKKIIDEIKGKISKKYPKYQYNVIIDTDFSD